MESVFVCPLCNKKYLEQRKCKCGSELVESCHKCLERKEDCAC